MVDACILSLQVPYQIYPLKRPVAGLPNVKETWVPILKVSIIIDHAISKRFEAVVDSGSAVCLFHAGIGKSLGLKVKEGELDTLGGVIGRSKGEVYYHD